MNTFGEPVTRETAKVLNDNCGHDSRCQLGARKVETCNPKGMPSSGDVMFEGLPTIANNFEATWAFAEKAIKKSRKSER